MKDAIFIVETKGAFVATEPLRERFPKSTLGALLKFREEASRLVTALPHTVDKLYEADPHQLWVNGHCAKGGLGFNTSACLLVLDDSEEAHA